MGARGPVGKRPDQRHGHGANRNDHDEVEPLPINWPERGQDWHVAMVRWYASLAQSGQAVDYQQTDVDMAWTVAEVVSRALNSDKPINSQIMSMFLSANTDLLASAGSRRRAKLELSRPDAGQNDAAAGAVASLAARRGRGA